MRADQFISKFFLPFSWLYGFGVGIRDMLYDEHILPSFRVHTPTICVGNLAVGGTGKTPHVEYLIDLLTRNGYRVGVVSRGYGRKTHGLVIADEHSTAITIGDEPMLLHAKYPQVYIAVCRNRIHAIHALERKMDRPDVFILDDAYQYRALRSGFNILLTSHDCLYVDDHLLPAGTLRDLPSQFMRANAIVVTKCPPHMTPIERRIVMTKLALPTYQQLYFSHMEFGPSPIDSTPLIVAGIANPDQMLRSVQAEWPNAEMMAFSDHHWFTRKDIDRITSAARNYRYVLTTEKDYARLMALPLPGELVAKLVAQPYRMVVDDEREELDKSIIRYVSEGLHQSR